MQLIYAAPFLFLAGVVFLVLSLVPRARRWAIPIPMGILGAGAFALVGFGAVAFWISRPPLRPMGHGFLVPFICAGAVTGLLGGILTWALARWVASRLSAILLRAAVFIVAWCSYSVMLAALLIWADYRFGLKDTGALGWSVELVLALIGAWLLSGRAEQFRPRRVRSRIHPGG